MKKNKSPKAPKPFVECYDDGSAFEASGELADYMRSVDRRDAIKEVIAEKFGVTSEVWSEGCEPVGS
jgi:hypothetical protein